MLKLVWGQEIHFSRFEKIRLFVFPKNALHQIKPWGRFCSCVQSLLRVLIFWSWFEVKRSIFQGLKKWNFLFFRKMLFYVRLSREGTFVAACKALKVLVFCKCRSISFSGSITKQHSFLFGHGTNLFEFRTFSLRCVGTKVHWPLCKPMIQLCYTQLAATAKQKGVKCSNFRMYFLL